MWLIVSILNSDVNFAFNKHYTTLKNDLHTTKKLKHLFLGLNLE